MLLPFYTQNAIDSCREFFALILALSFIIFLFWHLNFYYMNILFAIRGFHVFTVHPPPQDNQYANPDSYILITRSELSIPVKASLAYDFPIPSICKWRTLHERRLDMSQVLTAEFGVGRRTGKGVKYSLLPADDTVQKALFEEAKTTLAQQTDAPPQFDPAEKYSSNEYLVLPVKHELAASLMELHEADRLQMESPDLWRRPLIVLLFLAWHGQRWQASDCA